LTTADKSRTPRFQEHLFANDLNRTIIVFDPTDDRERTIVGSLHTGYPPQRRKATTGLTADSIDGAKPVTIAHNDQRRRMATHRVEIPFQDFVGWLKSVELRGESWRRPAETKIHPPAPWDLEDRRIIAHPILDSGDESGRAAAVEDPD